MSNIQSPTSRITPLLTPTRANIALLPAVGTPMSLQLSGSHHPVGEDEVAGGPTNTAAYYASTAGLQLSTERNNNRLHLLRELNHAQQQVGRENDMMKELVDDVHHMISAEDMAEVLTSIFYQESQKPAILLNRKPSRIDILKGIQQEVSSMSCSNSVQGSIAPKISGSPLGASISLARTNNLAEVPLYLRQKQIAVQSLRGSDVSHRTKQALVVAAVASGNDAGLKSVSAKVNYVTLLEQQRDLLEKNKLKEAEYRIMTAEILKNQNIHERFNKILDRR